MGEEDRGSLDPGAGVLGVGKVLGRSSGWGSGRGTEAARVFAAGAEAAQIRGPDAGKSQSLRTWIQKHSGSPWQVGGAQTCAALETSMNRFVVVVVVSLSLEKEGS